MKVIKLREEYDQRITKPEGGHLCNRQVGLKHIFFTAIDLVIPEKFNFNLGQISLPFLQAQKK